MPTNEKFWIGFGDIHEDLSLVNEIPDLADAEGVIISGDITNRGGSYRYWPQCGCRFYLSLATPVRPWGEFISM